MAPVISTLNCVTGCSCVQAARYRLFKVNTVSLGYTATDFNINRGTKNVQESAKLLLVEYTLLDADGPTGKFISDDGETAW